VLRMVGSKATQLQPSKSSPSPPSALSPHLKSSDHQDNEPDPWQLLLSRDEGCDCLGIQHAGGDRYGRPGCGSAPTIKYFDGIPCHYYCESQLLFIQPCNHLFSSARPSCDECGSASNLHACPGKSGDILVKILEWQWHAFRQHTPQDLTPFIPHAPNA
jgi:hypothetical protein